MGGETLAVLTGGKKRASSTALAFIPISMADRSKSPSGTPKPSGEKNEKPKTAEAPFERFMMVDVESAKDAKGREYKRGQEVKVSEISPWTKAVGGTGEITRLTKISPTTVITEVQITDPEDKQQYIIRFDIDGMR